MNFLNFNISSTDCSDARVILQDKVSNPGLSKEVTSPISCLFIPIGSFYSTTSHKEDIAPYYEILYINYHANQFKALKDDALTNMCLSISENSLKDEWENENDAHWQSFLND